MSETVTGNDFDKHYEEESFWKKVRAYAITAGKAVIEKALVLYYCLQDRDTPAWAKSVIIGTLGYFVWPLDAIADPTPVVGYSDDLGALASAMIVVAVHIKAEHRQKAKDKLTEWFGEEKDSG